MIKSFPKGRSTSWLAYKLRMTQGIFLIFQVQNDSSSKYFWMWVLGIPFWISIVDLILSRLQMTSVYLCNSSKNLYWYFCYRNNKMSLCILCSRYLTWVLSRWPELLELHTRRSFCDFGFTMHFMLFSPEVTQLSGNSLRRSDLGHTLKLQFYSTIERKWEHKIEYPWPLNAPTRNYLNEDWTFAKEMYDSLRQKVINPTSAVYLSRFDFESLIAWAILKIT